MGSLLALIHPFGEACQREFKIAIKYVSVIKKNCTKEPRRIIFVLIGFHPETQSDEIIKESDLSGREIT
jgi:hypothetical protein